MPVVAKNEVGVTLRLWRRGGPVKRRAVRKGVWPFVVTKPGAAAAKVPLLWRDYAWGPLDVESTGRKPRPARASRSGVPARQAPKQGSFDCTALTGSLVPLGVFGIEKAAAQQSFVGTKH